MTSGIVYKLTVIQNSGKVHENFTNVYNAIECKHVQDELLHIAYSYVVGDFSKEDIQEEGGVYYFNGIFLGEYF